MYADCILNCAPGDLECISICARSLEQNLTKCPCQSGCPNGCPCPEYICPVTTTSAISTTADPSLTSILILNTQDREEPRNIPVIINVRNGNVEYPIDDFMFLYAKESEVYESCSMTWRGKFFIFGGRYEQKQISSLNGCKLERVGSLSFHFPCGACANVDDQSIYLCFSEYGKKLCWHGNNPSGSFKETSPSSFSHARTRIGASSG